MKTRHLIPIVLLSVLVSTCKENPTTQQDPAPIRALSLSASQNNVASPVDIIFTGTFNAYSDTARMRVPDMFLMGAPNRTIIRYILPDTSVSARRSYTYLQQFISTGTYSIYMVLQTMQGDIFSDTLVVTIK